MRLRQSSGHCPWLQLFPPCTAFSDHPLSAPQKQETHCSVLKGLISPASIKSTFSFHPSTVDSLKRSSRAGKWCGSSCCTFHVASCHSALSSPFCTALLLFQPLCKHLLPLPTPPEAEGSMNIIAFASHRNMTSFRNLPCHRQDEKARLRGSNLPRVRTQTTNSALNTPH